MIIEVHLIQSIPTSRLNRDRAGQPKTVMYGGSKRLRISSQAQKRALRTFCSEHGLIEPGDQAFLSRLLPERLTAGLVAAGIDRARATDVVSRAVGAMGMKLNDAGQNEYMLFHGSAAFEALQAAMLEHLSSLEQTTLEGDTKKKIAKNFPKEVGHALKQALVGERNLEVSLYGRKLTDLPEGDVDGQVQIMHAFSVHAYRDETDFFTAMDDYAAPATAVAGHLHEHGIGAPTMYRMGAVNLARLESLVGPERARIGARAFLEAFAYSLPSGAQNSFSAHALPSFVLFQRVDVGEALNLAPVFERPLVTKPSRSMSSTAVEAMDHYIALLERSYERYRGRQRICVNLTDHAFESGDGVESLSTAIDGVVR